MSLYVGNAEVVSRTNRDNAYQELTLRQDEGRSRVVITLLNGVFVNIREGYDWGIRR